MFVFRQILSQGAVNVQSLRDIKPPLNEPQSLFPYVLLGTFIFAVVAIACWLYLRKHRQILLSPPEEEVVRLSHEIAYQQLEALEAAECDMETYHTRLAYVIREYIAARYRIPALELTTVGVLEQMHREEISVRYVACIQHFLGNCDKVKFAMYQPEQAEAAARIVEARWIVDETKFLAE